MPEGMTDTQIQADELSSRLFDSLVDDVLRGEDVRVAIIWGPEDKGEYGYHELPEVSIGGRSAFDYVRRPMEYSAANTPELIAATAEAFEKKVGTMWIDTLAFYKELDELDTALTGLSVSLKAGYFDRVRAKLHKQDRFGVADSEVAASARQLAIQELSEWVEAVDAQAKP